MNKNVVSTTNAPSAIGPYSQAISIGDFIFLSGQLPVNIENGELETSPKEATIAALKNMENVLRAAGSSLDKVVKTTIFLADINNFAVVNEAYSTFFITNPPARSCVEVSNLPKGAILEIEAIAVK